MLKLENVSYVVDGKRILTNLNMEFRENRKYVILGIVMEQLVPEVSKTLFHLDQVMDHRLDVLLC